MKGKIWYELFHDIRNWNKEWDSFLGKGVSPKNIDLFIEEIEKRYTLVKNTDAVTK